MANESLTPREAALVEKAKREEKWKALLKYFIMQEIMKAQEREIAMGYAEGRMIGEILTGMTDYVAASGLAQKIFEKEAGMLSSAEMLKEAAAMEKEDSPFVELNQTLQKTKDTPEINQALARCLTNASTHIIKQAEAEAERRENLKPEQSNSLSNRLQERQFDRRLRLQMNFLQRTMPGEMYSGLCLGLQQRGIVEDPELVFNGQISEKDIRREKLEDVHEVMSSMTTGQTPRFYKALGGLEQFLASDVQGPKQRDMLAVSLADYVVNDCVPGSRSMSEEGFRTAMYGLKAVLPENQFNGFVQQLNQDPRRRIALDPNQFDRLPEPALDGPAEQLEMERVLRPERPE